MPTSERKTILKAVVGSQAYGLATPESDVDYLGVFVVPTDIVLGIRNFQETDSKTSNPDKIESPDTTLHEVGKFMRLVASANPTVMELLWLDQYQEISPEGQLLIDGREHFLSARMADSYGGYAMKQFKRLTSSEDAAFSSTLRNRTEKHGRHMMRLIIQGTWALEHGSLRVRLTPEEVQTCREFGQLAASFAIETRACKNVGRLPGEPTRRFLAWVDELMKQIDNTQTNLPKEPNWDAISDILVRIRRMN